MDYTTWTQMQPNPNYTPPPNPQINQIHHNPNFNPTPPNPQNPQLHQNPNYPNAQNPNYLDQNYCYPQSVNPNSSIDQHHFYHDHHNPALIQQPVAEPYNSGIQVQHIVGYEYGYQYAVNGQLESSDIYYLNADGFGSNEHVAVNQYAFNANALGVNTGTYRTNQPQHRGKWKKAPKKMMVVQSAWCDICHIKCDTNDVLELHRQGKKHKKNLEKHIKAAASVPTLPSASFAPVPVTIGTQIPAAAPIPASVSSLLVGHAASVVPMIGPQENPNKASKDSNKKKRPKSEPLDNLETKKMKVLEGGAAAEAVRTCSFCNVVCNSDTVYSYHLAGQKHATMMKKHALLTIP